MKVAGVCLDVSIWYHMRRSTSCREKPRNRTSKICLAWKMRTIAMLEAILQLLANAPGLQTAAELCDALRRGGLRAEEYQVVEQLRRLLRDGFVRLEGIRWRLLRMPPNVSVASHSRFQAPLAPTKTDSSSASPNHAVAPLPPMLSLHITGRWALFRRLCRYYMDCLLQD